MAHWTLINYMGPRVGVIMKVGNELWWDTLKDTRYFKLFSAGWYESDSGGRLWNLTVLWVSLKIGFFPHQPNGEG